MKPFSFFLRKDKPAVVKEITEKHTSYDDHEKTTTPNNLRDSSRHNGKKVFFYLNFKSVKFHSYDIDVLVLNRTHFCLYIKLKPG